MSEGGIILWENLWIIIVQHRIDINILHTHTHRTITIVIHSNYRVLCRHGRETSTWLSLLFMTVMSFGKKQFLFLLVLALSAAQRLPEGEKSTQALAVVWSVCLWGSHSRCVSYHLRAGDFMGGFNMFLFSLWPSLQLRMNPHVFFLSPQCLHKTAAVPCGPLLCGAWQSRIIIAGPSVLLVLFPQQFSSSAHSPDRSHPSVGEWWENWEKWTEQRKEERGENSGWGSCREREKYQ